MKQKILNVALISSKLAFSGLLLCALVAGSSHAAFAQDGTVQLDQAAPPAFSFDNMDANSDDAANVAGQNEDTSSPPSLSDSIGIAADDQNMIPMMPVQSEKTDAEKMQEERKAAFAGAVDGMMPLKPAEIRRILELYDETSQAVETPIYPNPEPESSFVQASLEPGAKPVVIKTAVGNVTTLSLVDVTGQPWPIQDLTWAGDFQVEQPETGSHLVRITPSSDFAQGNISMRLVGLNPPVIFTLRTERKTVHVRLDVQIPEVGPKGVLPPVVTPISIKAGDDALTKVLLGIPSAASMSKMDVSGVDGRTTAYIKDGLMYVRTPYTMLSPAWMKSVQSADGMHVYALESTPVVLLSDKGTMVRAYLSPMEQANGE